MNVTYFINTGTPCSIPYGVYGVSLKDAIADFQSYINDCKKFGNDYTNASMDVTCDRRPSRLYVIGPRGGIVRLREWG